ncbi:MAG: tRNA (5-methylaminomethyl-2-thiouridylate)-methyltransferase, partial [Magnetococcales bacterium]|nr:tRNA (5-methylaminomethyl-2-thiouridylate)-methyltransferase [Magnetococcales bacterium]
SMGFHFIFSGEVVGERPMSQRKDTMPLIQREAGVEGWLLRPLCAHVLPPTQPELRGWVNRQLLTGITGRSRKPQMAMAAQFGITEYPSPAGGCCFLTDVSYAHKLKDLWDHRGDKRYTLDDIWLLKAGRHLRPDPRFKVIVGRDESENQFLAGFRNGRIAINAPDVAGPLALVEGEVDEAALLLACRLVARFGKGRHLPQVDMEVEREGALERFTVAPLPAVEIPTSWYIL